MDTTAIFNGLYTAITQARWEIRSGRNTIARAMSSGVGRSRVMTDQGIGRGVTGQLRYLAADDIAGTDVGDVIEARPSGGDWQSFRIGARREVGTIVELELENPDE